MWRVLARIVGMLIWPQLAWLACLAVADRAAHLYGRWHDRRG